MNVTTLRKSGSPKVSFARNSTLPIGPALKILVLNPCHGWDWSHLGYDLRHKLVEWTEGYILITHENICTLTDIGMFEDISVKHQPVQKLIEGNKYTGNKIISDYQNQQCVKDVDGKCKLDIAHMEDLYGPDLYLWYN